MLAAYVGAQAASGDFFTENDALDTHVTIVVATGAVSFVAVWALTRPRLRTLAVVATPVAGLAVGYVLAAAHGATGAEEGAVWLGGAGALLGVIGVAVALLVGLAARQRTARESR